jgi:selenocysteine lyase/cysteine desulfurase
MRTVGCAIVTARVDAMGASDVAAALGRARINVSTTEPDDTQFDTEARGVHPLVRLSPHYYDTEAEIDRTVETIAELIPRRRGL